MLRWLWIEYRPSDMSLVEWQTLFLLCAAVETLCLRHGVRILIGRLRMHVFTEAILQDADRILEPCGGLI